MIERSKDPSGGKCISEGSSATKAAMETRFRMEFGEPLQVGEMLIVDNGVSDEKYLIRVMDIEHGADSDEQNWMVTEAGKMLKIDLKNDEYDLEQIKGQLFCTGIC